jgi:threonine dehydratase
MSVTTTAIRISGVRAPCGQVILQGDTYNDAAEFAMKFTEERGDTFVHAFDDRDVIAGQGMVVMLNQYTNNSSRSHLLP